MIFLNGNRLSFEQFPNGETNIKPVLINSHIFKGAVSNIQFWYQSDADLIKLMFVVRHIQSYGGSCNLKMYYMPYERMDRVENNSVFTLKYVAEFINSLEFNIVEIGEPHSDVVMALVDRSAPRYFTQELLQQALHLSKFDIGNDYAYFPDAGAAKRYGKMFKFRKVLVGHKDRDFDTGVIKDLQIIGIGEPSLGQGLAGAKVLMIDDLCSRGGTFMMGAKALKARNAGAIYLLVGHCEDTVNEGEIPDSTLIERVFTTNSILTHYNSKFTVLDLLNDTINK